MLARLAEGDSCADIAEAQQCGSEHNKQDHAEARQGGGVRLRHMTAKRKPKKAALVLTDDDRAALFSLPDDKRAMSKI